MAGRAWGGSVPSGWREGSRWIAPRPQRRRLFMRSAQLVPAALLVCLAPAAADSPVSLAESARAILGSRCISCHGLARLANLDLRTRPAMLHGGTRGPAVVPGDASASLLYQAVARAGELRMPPADPAADPGRGRSAGPLDRSRRTVGPRPRGPVRCLVVVVPETAAARGAPARRRGVGTHPGGRFHPGRARGSRARPGCASRSPDAGAPGVFRPPRTAAQPRRSRAVRPRPRPRRLREAG